MTSDADESEPDAPELVHWSPRRGPTVGGGGRPPSPGLAGAVLLTAVGALAMGAVAVGALAVGTLVIGRTRIGELKVDRLEVGDLIVMRQR